MEIWEVDFVERESDVHCHIVIKGRQFSARGFGKTRYQAMKDAIGFLITAPPKTEEDEKDLNEVWQ